MVKIPGSKPPVPPMPPKEPAKPSDEGGGPRRPVQPPQSGETRPPQLDAQGIAVRLAALAHKAKELELSFEEIVNRVMEETGIKSPQAAMEEANRKLQEEIEKELEAIKANKDLMEEAEAWQDFAELLESKLSLKQVNEFFRMLWENVQED